LLLDAQTGDPNAQSELFELLQKVRSSATAQTVAQLSARLSSGDTAQAAAIRQVQNLDREVNILAARVDRLEADPNADLHLRRVTEQKLNDAQADLERAKASLAEIAPNFDQLSGTVIPLAEAQAAMADGEVMAAIQLGPDKGLVLVLSNVSFDVYEITMSLETAEEEVRALREPIDGEYLLPFELDRAYSVYRTLFGPATARIEGAKHLIIVPSGPLTSLPFNALVAAPYTEEIQIAGMDTGEPFFDYSQVPFVGRKSALTTGVSISSFFLGRRVPASNATRPFRGYGDFVAFGEDAKAVERIARSRELAESCYDSIRALGRLNELSGTRTELEMIANTLNVPTSDEVLGGDFTDSEVKAENLADYRVLHFATHGLLAQSPECLPEPGLVTSLAPDGDALLEASEIVDLHLDAELVVMSACDTSAGAGVASEALTGFRGVGGSYAAGGESLNGLARSFFYAGARNVVSSYWSVDDIATQELMVAFYGASATNATIGIAEALRQAEEGLIAGGKHSHPFFWAPFATIGDGARSLRLGGGASAAAASAPSGT
jgi:CHAT domain-containing protein